jgi:hypothetical protein
VQESTTFSTVACIEHSLFRRWRTIVVPEWGIGNRLGTAPPICGSLELRGTQARPPTKLQRHRSRTPILTSDVSGAGPFNLCFGRVSAVENPGRSLFNDYIRTCGARGCNSALHVVVSVRVNKASGKASLIVRLHHRSQYAVGKFESDQDAATFSAPTAKL